MFMATESFKVSELSNGFIVSVDGKDVVVKGKKELLQFIGDLLRNRKVVLKSIEDEENDMFPERSSIDPSIVHASINDRKENKNERS